MTTHFNVLANFDGKLTKKSYFVSDLAMARQSAIADGAMPIFSIKKISQNWLTQQYIGRDYAMLLLRAIVFQVDAGVPAIRAVQAAVESEMDSSRRAQLQGAIDALARGASLSESLYATGLYDLTVKSILAAGEGTGNGNAVKSALDYMEERKSAGKAYAVIFSALAMEMSTAFTLPPSIHGFVVPYLREHAPKTSPEKLDAYFKRLDTLAFNNELWMWFSNLIVAVLCFAVIAWFTNPRAKDWMTHHVLVKLPLVGDWYANDALSRTCKVFSSMLKAGVRIDNAIHTILRSTHNGMAKQFWSKSRDALNIGATHSAAFASTGMLRQDEILVLKAAQGNKHIAQAFLSMSTERTYRQKALGSKIFRASIILMFVYIGITLLIGFHLFGLFNEGMDMSMNALSKGF